MLKIRYRSSVYYCQEIANGQYLSEGGFGIKLLAVFSEINGWVVLLETGSGFKEIKKYKIEA